MSLLSDLIPVNKFRAGSGIELSGILSAAAAAGDVVTTTNGTDWAKATSAAITLKGVLMDDPVKGSSFASGDSVAVRVTGLAVVRSAGVDVVDEGDLLEVGTVDGQVDVYDIGTDANDATMKKVLGTALSAAAATPGLKVLILLKAGG